MNILDKARDNAVQDAIKVITGDQKKGFMNSVASFFRSGKENPLFDALAFGSAISSFFPKLTQLVEALASKGGAKVDDTKTLSQIAKSDEMIDSIKKIITQGLRPNGILAKLGAGWAEKYLDGSIDDLANEIMNSTLGEIKKVASSVKQSTDNIERVSTDIPPQPKDDSAKPKDDSDTPSPNADPKKQLQNAYGKIKGNLGDLDQNQRKIVASVLRELIKQNLLK
jgi:hypothetical protein